MQGRGMTGRGGSSTETGSGTSLSSRHLGKGANSTSHIGKHHAPMNYKWSLGISLEATKDAKLVQLYL